MPKLFLIACEPSGDLHGAHLVEELRKLDPSISLAGLGGPQMAAQGVRLLHDMTQISALGLGDVLRQYFKYRKIFYEALREVERLRPDALVLIDSPAFNLRFAKKINRRFPVLYYVSPQIWAWGGRRIKTIKKFVSKMIVILPFEKALYEKAGVPVEFVGHPLLDELVPIKDIESLQVLGHQLEIRPTEVAIGLLPGSREPEIKRILPVMLQCAEDLHRQWPRAVFFLAQAPNVKKEIYEKILSGHKGLPLWRCDKDFHEVLSAAHFALITSGTATLEAALLGVPFFLFYKASWSTYWLGRQLIRVPYLGMANLLAGKSIVPEFIQFIDPRRVADEAKKLLENPEAYATMKSEFDRVRKLLGEEGASERAAQTILSFLRGVPTQTRAREEARNPPATGGKR